MRAVGARELARRFRDQHGVLSRDQLRAIGVSPGIVRRRLQSGEWETVVPRVVRLSASARTPEQRLLADCLAVGPSAIASHLSAAWLWHLSEPPERHHLTVPRALSARSAAARVHRPRDFPAQVAMLKQIPCTTPLRTIVDVAGLCPPDELEDIMDRALSAKLVDIAGVEAELARVCRSGRPGVDALRRELKWRRPLGLEAMSVLESKTLRLLERSGVKPAGVEVSTAGGPGYRLDILLGRGLAMEVDGYAYHHSPEQMTEDARRRNRLLASGITVLVYTWKDIAEDGHRVIAEVRHLLGQSADRKHDRVGQQGNPVGKLV